MVDMSSMVSFFGAILLGMDKLQSMDEVPLDELPLVLQRPRGHSGPLLELIARRIRTEAESEIEIFNLRPRHVVALTLLQLVGEQSQSDLGDVARAQRSEEHTS